MQCGRGPSDNVNDGQDSCPVATTTAAHSSNGGINGGRICWVIADACCNGEVRCSDHHRKDSCFQCEFRYKVMMEEGLLNVCKATGLLLQHLNAKVNRLKKFYK